MSRSASRSFSRGGMLSLARLASGLVRVKIVALALGVGGVGVFALAQQANLTAVSLVSMSLAVPIINLGRPLVASSRFDEAGRVAGTSLTIVAFNLFVLLIAAALAGPVALSRIGEGQIEPILLWPLVAAIALGALASSFWEGLSYLTDRFDVYVKAGIASAIAELVFISAGAWSNGLRGAILAMPAGPLALILSYAWLLHRDGIARAVLSRLSFAKAELPRLLTFSAMMFAAVGVTNVALTAARASVLVHSGASANGNLQTATSLSAYILAFVTTGFWGHLHAHAASEGDVASVRRELNEALERGLLISFTGCGIASVLPELLLPLFYSKQFSGAAQLVTAYMPGEFCFQFLTLLISYQLTVSLRRRYLAWSLGYVGLLFVVAAIAIPKLGAAGYVSAHVLAAIVMTAIAALICWRAGQITNRTALLAGALFLTLISSSVALLLEPAAGILWRLIALLPYLASGAVVGKQLLSTVGIPRKRMADA